MSPEAEIEPLEYEFFSSALIGHLAFSGAAMVSVSWEANAQQGRERWVMRLPRSAPEQGFGVSRILENIAVPEARSKSGKIRHGELQRDMD